MDSENRLKAKEMNASLRIKPHQKEGVRKKAIEINKVLIKKGLEPVKDSELMHIIIDNGIKMLSISEEGKISLQCE